MKTYKQSKVNFTIIIILDIVLLCPTLGLWIFVLIWHMAKYNNNTLTISDKSIILKTGVFNTQTKEIPFSKINSISINQGWIAKSYGYGDLVIFSGNDTSGIIFKEVDKPEMVKKEITRKLSNNN